MSSIPVLPLAVSSFLASRSAFGFSGSRSCVLPAGLWSAVASAVPVSASVSVGCAPGLDALARASFPSASVFSVSSFGRGRGAFASRSVALVRSVAALSSSCWVSFPSASCPAGLLPSASSSRCFCGLGSGSWASLALAVGLGVPVLVWLPASVPVPGSWGFVSLGGGWFVR